MNYFSYSHGFLFPSEVTRVRKYLFSYLDTASKQLLNRAPADSEHQRHLNGVDGGTNGQDQVPVGTDVSVRLGTPLAWAHSSVSTFGVRYSPPIQDMPLWHSIEALVEGSDMSMLREGLFRSIFYPPFSRVLTRVVASDSPMTPDYAWAHREGRNTRYDNKRVGGTICVHFIKKNMWFLETAIAFLEMQDTTELEIHPSEPDEGESGLLSPDAKKSRTRTGHPSGYREGPDPVPVELEPDLVDLDAEEEHDPPIEPAEDVHVLLFQGDAKDLDTDVDGRSGYSLYPQADEPERPEDLPGDDSKREIASDAHGGPEDEEAMTLASAGHFANGSRKVYNR